MKKLFILTAVLIGFQTHADTITTLSSGSDFFGWLESHTQDFGSCSPQKKGDAYELCDHTLVSQAELKQLFQLTPDKLVAAIQAKGIKIEILCDASVPKAPFKAFCTPKSPRKMFKEISALHGQYLPAEKTILIRSSATPGSLIHEYIHFLESENTNPVYGKIYKKERNQIQAALTQAMDEDTQKVQALQKGGKKSDLSQALGEFKLAAEELKGFAPWQDLIDERSIFLLYLQFGSEFGATDADKTLARKNMTFICNNLKLKSIVPPAQCTL